MAALSTRLPRLQLGPAGDSVGFGAPLSSEQVDGARAAAFASLGDVAAVAAAAVGTVSEPISRRWKEEDASAGEQANHGL